MRIGSPLTNSRYGRLMKSTRIPNQRYNFPTLTRVRVFRVSVAIHKSRSSSSDKSTHPRGAFSCGQKGTM